jgi:hydroxymethylglutaryl-CoA lyase
MQHADVKLIECPRDAWQGLKGHIPSGVKTAYLRALIGAGFKHLDAASFVSPKTVPQMADSEDVLQHLDPPDDVEIIGIVVNEQGAQRAITTNAVHTLGFPYSISPTFLMRNQRQTLEEAYDQMEEIKQKADQAGLDMVVYISMAFGNPYGDLWSPDEVVEAVGIVEQMGVPTVSLADTAGVASAGQISEVVSAVNGKYDYLEIGLHLHSLPGQVLDKILAAYEAGARRFDSVIGGLGGCPFAHDALMGNIPTERLLEAFARLGLEPPIVKPLENVVRMSADIAARYGGSAAADQNNFDL